MKVRANVTRSTRLVAPCPCKWHATNNAAIQSTSRTLALRHVAPIIDAFRVRRAAVVRTRERNVCVALLMIISFLAGEVACCGIEAIEDDVSAAVHWTKAFVVTQGIQLCRGHCARLHCKMRTKC